MDYAMQCRVQAASATGFGLSLLLAPVWLTGWFGVPGGLGTEVIGRLCGAMLVGLGGTMWAVATVEDPLLRRRLAFTNGAVDGGVAVMIAIYVASGQVAALGWALVGLFVVNAITWALAARSV